MADKQARTHPTQGYPEPMLSMGSRYPRSDRTDTSLTRFGQHLTKRIFTKTRKGKQGVLKHGAPVESNVPLQNVIQVSVLGLNLRNAEQ